MIRRITIIDKFYGRVGPIHTGAIDGLPAPDCRINPRAKFWFTEFGWEKVGRKAIEILQSEGHRVVVRAAKNPPASAVVYSDQYQVAILPIKGIKA